MMKASLLILWAYILVTVLKGAAFASLAKQSKQHTIATVKSFRGIEVLAVMDVGRLSKLLDYRLR